MDEGLDRVGGAYRLERHVGSASGVTAEVWRSMVSGDVRLVVFPAVDGHKFIASGTMADVSLLSDMGGVVLSALRGTAPLLSGAWFRSALDGIVDRS